jgi:hypothetical protein
MKPAAIVFAVLALIAGMKAAWHWYQSATESPPGMDILGNYVKGGTGLTPIESWLEKTASRNRKAAGWSALAVVLGAISSILSTLA